MIMECYFMVDTYMDEEKGIGMYDEYIRKVKPIVEALAENICFERKISFPFIPKEARSG